ncbi:MAG: hypothetical protein QXM93_09050 [Candidatus Methanomethyliaceae archaeon]|nr:hypothetical protein [Candidatus Verstraetearchaeota archaeon]
MPEKVEKKLVVVRADVLEKISEMARRENKTLFALVNEILQDALKVSEMKVTVGDLTNFYKLIKVQKDSGALILPMDLFLKLIQKWDNKEDLEKEWFSAGEWYGKYLMAKFEDPLNILPSLLSTSLWHLSEVKMEGKSDGRTTISMIAPNADQTLLELTGKYLEGVMNALGFRSIRSDIVRGVGIIEFLKKL